jgi:malate dehydrogenase (oxaloacetate-decarboxylating)
MSALPSYPLFDPSDPVFRAHEGGKLGVHATQPLRDRADLALLYTPGVADVSRAIALDPSLAARYTARGNTVAVITDGTAVLGLGDIGPLAAMPVMEGKAVLFKHFGGVDAVPVCMQTGSVDELVEAIVRIAPTYGGINLEDISAPRCFEIERQLQDRLDIPVFHDDQHGTAIVVLAGLTNAAKVVGRTLESLRVVVSGAGAAGVAVTKLLARAGVADIVVCDSRGIVSPTRRDLADHKRRLAATTNPRGLSGSLGDALVDADVFVGVSGGQVPEAEIARMAPSCIIFALANPDPEVHPDIASRYAAVVATGRSDFPNQINNVLAFPGIFRGALDSGAQQITETMKLAAAAAIAGLVELPTAEEIVPSVFQEGVAHAVAVAVRRLAEQPKQATRVPHRSERPY